ncbi:MAG: VOC family protein [Bacteroidetes bacterium]|nr:VOC family protein [Bacteroidota bacterium]
MKQQRRSNIFSLLVLFITTLYCSGNAIDTLHFSVRFEHIAFNVKDPLSVAQWYVRNLNMKIMRQGGPPTFTTFIADSGEFMMIEFFTNAAHPHFPADSLSVMSLHLAFATPNIHTTVAHLLAAGASWADTIQTTPLGDIVCILRDPWGLPLQIVQRKTPMLTKSGTYLEHIAFNVGDSRRQAQWYLQKLSLKLIREGKAPSYGMFLSDSVASMMFELYQHDTYPLFAARAMSSMSFHVAFSVPNIKVAKDVLTTVGATVEDDITVTSAGDKVLMLRDPWGIALQFVTRAHPMLKQ